LTHPRAVTRAPFDRVVSQRIRVFLIHRVLCRVNSGEIREACGRQAPAGFREGRAVDSELAGIAAPPVIKRAETC
jgi:hypothetical protein